MADYSITVDRDLCIGSGMCVAYAPGTFDQDDDAKSVLLTPSTDTLEAIRSAIDACPMRALQLHES
jgi:ferredoxin